MWWQGEAWQPPREGAQGGVCNAGRERERERGEREGAPLHAMLPQAQGHAAVGQAAQTTEPVQIQPNCPKERQAFTDANV